MSNARPPFSIALAWILSAEGGLVSNTADKGGTTKYGISISYLRSLPLKWGDLNHDGNISTDDIRQITREQAAEIYLRDFWTPAKCDSMPLAVAMCHLDGCVLMGQGNASRILQRAAGVDADGVVGLRTLGAVSAMQIDEFLPRYLSQRARYCAEIVRHDDSQRVFEHGWYSRLFRLQAAVIGALLTPETTA